MVKHKSDGGERCETSPVRVSQLGVGATIACPITGDHEKITTVLPHVGGRVFIRTTRHDHVRSGSDVVQVVDRPGASPQVENGDES